MAKGPNLGGIKGPFSGLAPKAPKGKAASQMFVPTTDPKKIFVDTTKNPLGPGPKKGRSAITTTQFPGLPATPLINNPNVPPPRGITRLKIPAHVSGTYSIGDIPRTKVKATTDKPTSRPNPATVATSVQTSLGGGTPAVQIPLSAGNVTPAAAIPLPGSATYVPVGTPNVDPYSGQTPGQVAQSELNPQLRLVGQNTAAETNAIRGLYDAIVAQQKGYVGQVGHDYNQALQVTNGLAQQAGAQLAAANPNDRAQALLASIGAPQSQQTQVADALQNTFQGGGAVLATTQGAIPSASLAAEKAAALQYARTLPQIQSLAALQAVHNLQYQGGVARNQIEAQAPTIMNNVASAKAGAAGTEASFEAQQNAQVAANALARAGYAQNNAALGLKAQGATFANKVTIAKLNLSSAKLTDAENATAASLGLKKAQLELNAKKFSAQAQGAQQKTLTTVSKQMEQWRYGKFPQQHWDAKTQAFIEVPGSGVPSYTYQQSIFHAVTEGLPFQAAVALADSYYEPGQFGRPNPAANWNGTG